MNSLSKQEQVIVIILAALQFTHIMDFMIMMPLSEQFMRVFKIDTSLFGLLVGSYAISAGISGLFGAFFIDKFDRKIALQVIYFGFIISSFGCSLSNGYHTFLIFRILTGAFGGLIGALILSIIGDVISNKKRAGAMGIVMTAFSLSAVLGVPLGLHFGTLYGWKVPFMIIGVIGLLINYLIFVHFPNLTSHLKANINISPIQIIKNNLQHKNQRIALLFIFLVVLGQFTVIPYLTPYMVNNVGFTELDLRYIYLLGGLVTIISNPLIGKFADKYGRKITFILFAVLSTVPIFLITNVANVDMTIALICTTLFFLFISGRMVPASTMMTSAIKHENRGSFMSLNVAVREFSVGISTLIASSIVYKSEIGEIRNYNVVGYIAVFATILAIMISRSLKRED